MKKLTKYQVIGDNGFFKAENNLQEEIIFPENSLKQQLLINDDDKEVSIDLIHYDVNTTKQFKLIQGKIKREDLQKIGLLFNLDSIHHPLNEETLMLKIPNLSNDYDLSSYGALKKENKDLYFVIFARRGKTNFNENIVYIHGIWKLNPENYTIFPWLY